MFIKSLSVAAIAASAVKASPLIQARQANTSVSAILSSVATTTAADATSTSSVSAPVNGTSGNQTYPGYSCPPGYLLTYTEQNISIPAAFPIVVDVAGLWSDSPLFNGLLLNNTGYGIGSTHFLNLSGIIVQEEIVAGPDTGSVRGFTWNLTSGPVEFMGIGISNYTTVLALYDPAYTNSTNGTQVYSGNTTALIYTNFCSTVQAEGITLVSGLNALELQNLAQAVALKGNTTSTPTATATASAGPTSVVSSASSAAQNTTLTS